MRLFIGLPLNEAALRDTAALAERCRASIPGRYTLRENYHMTLAFLGSVPQDRLGDASHALARFAACFPAPRIELCDLSYFKQPSSAILIRSVRSPDDLCAMHGALLALLDEYGLPHTDGPFSPHVTLARHADVSSADRTKLSVPPVSFIAPEAVLYLSARDEMDTLRYTPLAQAPFGG